MTKLLNSDHKHFFIQKVDDLDLLRWHECIICKASEDCDCSELEFEKRLKKSQTVKTYKSKVSLGQED